MKNVFLILSAVAVLVVGCKVEDHILADLEDRLELLESGSVPKVDAQIDSITRSIEELKKTNTELDSYIDELEKIADEVQEKLDDANTAIEKLEEDFSNDDTAQILEELNELKSATEAELDIISVALEELKAKDIELEAAIKDLETFVSEQLADYATTEWTEATFATLEQYNKMQDHLTEVNALIKITQESIADLEERVNEKIATDIAAAVEGLEEQIADEVTAITAAYTDAISTARSEIEAAYTSAIADAIAASEESIKEWVNDTLAEGYYTISDIDILIQILEVRIKALEKHISGNGDSGDDDSGSTDIGAVAILELQNQITALQTALDDAKEELTAAYMDAIAEAIEKNNGEFDTKIKEAIEDALTDLDEQIDSINTTIEGLKDDIKELSDRLDAVETDIKDIKEQLEKLMNQVQSISYIPRTTDGTVRVSLTPEGTAAAFLDFFVSPASAVSTLNTEELWKTAISIQAVYTSTHGTENIQLVTLPVIEYNGNDTDGIVTVKVDASGLSEDFFTARAEASAFMKISDGNTNHISDYVRLTANSIVWPGGFTVNDWITSYEIEGDANEK